MCVKVKDKKNTLVEYLEFGTIAITLHDTEIVRFNGESIVLNSGGWRTRVTKERLNQISEEFDLGYHVFPTNGGWSVGFEREVLDFEDGMVLQRTIWKGEGEAPTYMGD